MGVGEAARGNNAIRATEYGEGQALVVEGNHSKANDRDAISFAYDLPGDFYALWLDKYMQYTCGYFASPDESARR